jgi:adenylate cyclase
MPQSRQLAAIMFTDIVGYTAMMGEDEQKAVEILRKNRDLQQSLIKQFNGTWIKELGDGVLASFNTATDAVLCATAIQHACNNVPGLKLRIGIHLGEVMFENNDVFGDNVNIASRIQALAFIGGICISEAVHQNVYNNKGISTKFVREETLKNVKDPVKIYEVITNNSLTATTDLSTVDLKKKLLEKSVAVLPFVNMSNDPDQEYFSDGIAEEIINSLVHIKDLKIAGRISSVRFKGKDIDLWEIGEKLGVGTVLEGSIRKQGNRLRITAQLINVEDGFHLWSEKYDRSIDDIFAIQDEIALAVTEQLKITLLEKDKSIITKTSTQNTEAYELYLKGRFHISRRGSSILTGLQFFKQAIAIDPSYALAYTGYANANMVAAAYSFCAGKAVMKEIKQALETAIQLDNSLSEAYSSLGFYYILERNWLESKKNFIKAIELKPSNAEAHSWYGMMYLNFIKGNFEEAEKQGLIAIKLEPLSAIDHADLAWTLHTARHFEEALAIAKIGIELDANSFLSHRLAGLCYIALKRYDKAIDTLKYLCKMSDGHQHAITALIWAYSSNGNIEEAEILLNELKERSVTEYIAGAYLGLSAAYMGDLDTAFNYLEKALDDYDLQLSAMKYAPIVPPLLKNDARFQNLIDKIGFPD